MEGDVAGSCEIVVDAGRADHIYYISKDRGRKVRYEAIVPLYFLVDLLFDLLPLVEER